MNHLIDNFGIVNDNIAGTMINIPMASPASQVSARCQKFSGSAFVFKCMMLRLPIVAATKGAKRDVPRIQIGIEYGPNCAPSERIRPRRQQATAASPVLPIAMTKALNSVISLPEFAANAPARMPGIRR